MIRFRVAAGNAYFEAIQLNPTELPSDVAKDFVKHMRACRCAAESQEARRKGAERIEPLPYARIAEPPGFRTRS